MINLNKLKNICFNKNYVLSEAIIKPDTTINSMISGITNLKNLNIEINTFIDVGASNGMWTRDAIKIYNESYYFLIEAQKEHLDGLKQTKKKFQNVDYIIAAVGDYEGEIYFDTTSLWGGLASKEKFSHKNYKIVNVTTIDKIIVNYNLKPPYLIKLDTHGYEKQILDGSINALLNTNALIIEAYNFHLTTDSLLFYELCSYMDKLGFYVFNIVDILNRPKDSVLWQMDIFFLKKNYHFFNKNIYQY